MTDSQLQITIKTVADTAAAEAVKAALRDLKAESKGVGEAGEAAGKGIGSGMEHAAHESRELHMAIRLASGSLGEFGHLLHFIFSPEALGIAGLIISMKLLNEQFAEMYKQSQKWIEFQKEVREENEKAAQSAHRMAQEQVAAFNLVMQHRRDNFDEIKSLIEQENKLYTEQQEHIKTLAGIEEEHYDKFIDKKVKAGKLTPEQGEQAKADEKTRIADLKEKSEEEKAQRDIDDKAKEAAKKTDLLAKTSGSDKDAAIAAKLRADAASIAADSAVERERGLLEDAKTKGAPDIEKWGKIEKAYKDSTDPSKSILERGEAKAALFASGFNGEKAAETKNLSDLAKQQIEIEKRAVADALDAQSKAKIAKDDANTNLKALNDEIAKIKNTLDDLGLAIKNATADLAQKKSEYRETRAASQPGFYEDKEAREAAAALPDSDAFAKANAAITAANAIKNQTHTATAFDLHGETVPSLLSGATPASLSAAAGRAKTENEKQAVLDALNEAIRAIHGQRNDVSGLGSNPSSTIASLKPTLSLDSIFLEAREKLLQGIKDRMTGSAASNATAPRTPAADPSNPYHFTTRGLDRNAADADIDAAKNALADARDNLDAGASNQTLHVTLGEMRVVLRDMTDFLARHPAFKDNDKTKFKEFSDEIKALRSMIKEISSSVTR